MLGLMGRSSKLFIVVNVCMVVIFAACVALQYNDPDPASWMVLYGLATLACLQYGQHRRDMWLPIAAFVFAAIWASVLAPELFAQADFSDLFRSMDDKGGAAELAREYAGLAIVMVWMLVLASKSVTRMRARLSNDG